MTVVGMKTVTVEKTVSSTKDQPSDRKLPENSKGQLDKRLDQASEESFPSSDPVSVKITK